MYKNPADRRDYQLEWMRKRRTNWLLANGPCKCGSWERLEIDHINPGSKVNHRIWSWTDEKREAELAKCQVLCFVHHREKTAAERWNRVQHGSYAMRVKGKCRCALCMEYVRRQKQLWRERAERH